jgi:two-component system sensor kinase FixL
MTETQTDTARAEDSEARARAILQTAVDGIFTIDERGAIESVNPAGERMFGYSCVELVGRNVAMLMPHPFAGEHDAYLARYLRTGEARVIGVGRQVLGRRKDDSTFPIQLSVSEWSLAGRRMFTGICHDISERRAMEERLQASIRMAALGEMAGKIAHEVNNPIAIIAGKARLRLTDPREEMSAGLRRDLEKIAHQCDRVAQLNRTLLNYSRPSCHPKSSLDLNRPLRRALDLAQDKVERSGISLIDALDPQLPPVVGNGHELEQVFLNLALNGIDAMREAGGTLRVTSSRDDRQVAAEFSDTGTGIAEDVRERIFEPFFTTKDKRGTGLGLAVCHGIVEDHGGEIHVDSAPGRGTRFRVTLPVHAA